MNTNFKISNGQLSLLVGDITQQTVDAIVNAANSSLMGGGGVDGAIHRAAGSELLEACKEVRRTSGPCSPGEAVSTIAGKLMAKHVIHTVGPVWKGGGQGEPEVLASCFRNCFSRALELGANSIAFPAISTGVYGYPVDKAAEISLAECIHFLTTNKDAPLKDIRMVLFSESAYSIFGRLLVKLGSDQ